MRLITLGAAASADRIPTEATVSHDVRDPSRLTRILARKGDRVNGSEIAAMLAAGVRELHLAIPAPDDLDENVAAADLAAAVAGPGIRVGRAHFGQATLTSAARGLVRVRRNVLDLINTCDGVLVMTGLPNCAADVDAPVAVVKCAPLYLAGETVRAVSSIVGEDGAVVSVEPFKPRRLALVAIEDRLRGGALGRATASLQRAVTWFGGSLTEVYRAPAGTSGVSDALRHAVASGADLIFTAGAAATDPLDVSFEGLRHAGGTVGCIGMPIEPGTACWFGHVESATVLGLASCELFGRPGALDLLLPRLFVGEELDAALLRELALGGLLDGPSRLLPYHDADDA